ncbi:hypothetical protein Avbf_05610 [Armadillidium vulgare]|nr:hypothetical protein Avbf_05610 [Armadillidium vulgare]
MRASNVEEISNPGTGDPWEVFTQLVIQIIEGRTPGGEKGFHAGPHCALPQYAGINRHVCDPDSAICFRFESLLRQLRLMWGVGVGVSVEVLVAPECEHGAAFTTALDNTTTAPSSQLRLIEQWNFIVFDRNMPEALISGWSLVAAVRSFLHFSQLSAWLSASGGSQPPNVLYRLTVTSPVFCSKFVAESEEHTFPIANVGQDTAIKVVVRSLPRSNRAPKVSCPEIHPKSEYHALQPSSSVSTLSLPPDHISSTPPPSSCPHTSTTTFSPSSSSSSTLTDFSSTTHPSFSPFIPVTSSHSSASSEFAFQGSGSQLKTEGNNKTEEDLRRSMMRARLGDPSRASRSESPDTQLGESLLDPPNSLSRIPRRFQSPSRSGSPSMETPEHIICRVRQPGPSHARPPDMPSDSYNEGRTSYSFTQSSNVPQNYFSSGSQNPLYWHHRSSNIPSSIYDKEISPLIEYPGLQTVQPSARLEYKNCNSQVSSNQEANDQDTCDFGNENLKVAAYNRQNEKYLEKFYEDSTSSNKIQVGHQCEELVETIESAASNTFFGKTVGNASTLSRVSDKVSFPSGKEPQGTKRKGAYNRESPRTKRESPPHIYYSKEGTESEVPKEESREDERVKRKNSDDDDDDDGTKRKANSNKRGTTSNKIWSKCSDDRLWPSCSQPGKHLCSSVEDLSDITAKDDCSDILPNSKNLKKKIFCKLDGTSSSKISFDLTPKETQEVLNVLRQNNPLPPLRIYQPKTSVSSKSTYIDSNLKLKNRDRNEEEEKKCLGLIEKLDSLPEPRKTSKISPYHKGEGSTGKARRCHRQEVSQTKTTVIKEDEKYAYPTSSNNCDTSFKKPINCSCDRKLNDRNIIKNTDINDSDDEVVDGLSPAEIHNLKQIKNALPINCVEAKKITHKTNYFTANSQPTLGTKDFLKQTSQALRKSPLTSVLSSIKKETKVTSVEDVPKTEEKTVERARRSLRFINEENLSISSKQERESTTGLPERIQQPRILAIKERDSKVFNETGNILKQLMKKNLSEENGYEKSLPLETKKVTHEGIHETERNGNKRTILSLEEEEATSSNEEDREVEDLCKSKVLFVLVKMWTKNVTRYARTLPSDPVHRNLLSPYPLQQRSRVRTF